MDDLLESYNNGQFAQCIVIARNKRISFSEFFDYYIENCSSDIEDLKLLIYRLVY